MAFLAIMHLVEAVVLVVLALSLDHLHLFLLCLVASESDGGPVGCRGWLTIWQYTIVKWRKITANLQALASILL